MSNEDPDRLFDQSFVRHASGLAIIAEEDAHRPFLDALFVACSPLRGVLPDPIVQHQAALRETAYRTDYPAAMRRIVVADGAPVGRIMVDWGGDGAAMLVDIAVVPDRQGQGVGMAMLRAYLDVVDRRGQPAMLQVMRDNPAQHLTRGWGSLRSRRAISRRISTCTARRALAIREAARSTRAPARAPSAARRSAYRPRHRRDASCRPPRASARPCA